MAVVSVRLNEEEEKILEYLSEYFHEDIQDIRFIEGYIAASKNKSGTFITSDELLD